MFFLNINPFCRRDFGYEYRNVFIMKVVSFPNDSEPIIILFNELAKSYLVPLLSKKILVII